MSEKLDLFELTVKRGLENLEMPLDNTAWSSFESAMDASQVVPAAPSSGGFLSKFALAAAILVGAVIFINQSVPETENSIHIEELVEVEQRGPQSSSTESAIDLSKDDRIEKVDQGRSETAQELMDSDLADKESQSVLTKAEKERMERINSKLQKAAEKSELEQSNESNLKTGTTTRYLGKDFNLGASKNFSPNSDGKNDTFIPESLKEGDLFLMTISQENGQVVFTTSDVSLPWEGRDTSNVEMEEGRYSWEVILQTGDKKEIFKGTVNLSR